jgi:hypothetical protein
MRPGTKTSRRWKNWKEFLWIFLGDFRSRLEKEKEGIFWQILMLGFGIKEEKRKPKIG